MRLSYKSPASQGYQSMFLQWCCRKGTMKQSLLVSATNLLFMVSLLPYSHAIFDSRNQNRIIKSEVFLSPKIVLKPGYVAHKYFYNIGFPKGHIALKDFHAQVIDETGYPVSPQHLYLHHWGVVRNLGPKNQDRNYTLVRNSGLCQSDVLGQYFGLGPEIEKTKMYVPDPYGIQVGNPKEIPDGYEEKWLLDIHVIDTRGVYDRLGCVECKCDLYNVTLDQYGLPFRPTYKGGLECCYDGTQCLLSKGFRGGGQRSLYFRYTVKWVDWDDSVLPVRIYVLDVTDTPKTRIDVPTGLMTVEHDCKVEYDIESCSMIGTGEEDNKCVDTKKTEFVMPISGYVIYAVAHQHIGSLGATLYKEDGKVICSSEPYYKKLPDSRDEDVYIEAMSSCYPEPDTIKIRNRETVTMESNYSSVKSHTGVMSLFHVFIAQELPKPVVECSHLDHLLLQVDKIMKLRSFFLPRVFLVGFAIVVAVVSGLHYRRKKNDEYGYHSFVKT